jgi:hypothetical protein
VNERLEKLMFDELKQSCNAKGFGGFLPGMKQIANVAALPGIVSVSMMTMMMVMLIKMMISCLGFFCG